MWHNTINQYQIPTVGYCMAYNTNAKWGVIWQNLAALIKKGAIFTFTRRKFNGSQRQCRINKKNLEAIYDFLLFLENVKDWLSSKLLSMNPFKCLWALHTSQNILKLKMAACNPQYIAWSTQHIHYTRSTVDISITHDPPKAFHCCLP